MTESRARELRDEARATQNRGELLAAGDLHTACAHEFAGCMHRSFPEPAHLHSALGHLLDAATCYRVGGDGFRAENRCELGTVLAEDRSEYVRNLDVRDESFEDLRRGVWHEFIGDLRTIAGRDDADEAYDRAVSIYTAAGEWEVVMAEQEHLRLLSYFRSLKRGLGKELPEDAPEAPALGVTFSEWIEYKRKTLPGLLDDIDKQGDWPRLSGAETE